MSDKCLVPECPRPSGYDIAGSKLHGSRGLCPVCYRALYERVKTKRTTWAALEEIGLALPPKIPVSLAVAELKKRVQGNIPIDSGLVSVPREVVREAVEELQRVFTCPPYPRWMQKLKDIRDMQ